MTTQQSAAVEVFWCRGAGIDRCAAWDKPERVADLPVKDCGKYRQHPSHTWTFISVDGKARAAGEDR